MFKKGDIVIFNGLNYKSNYDSNLIINKKYIIENINGSYFKLKGEPFNYHITLFKDITELRNEKIKKINNEINNK